MKVRIHSFLKASNPFQGFSKISAKPNPSSSNKGKFYNRFILNAEKGLRGPANLEIEESFEAPKFHRSKTRIIRVSN